MICCDVYLEDRPVDGLRRIMLGVGVICDGRIVGRRGASAAAQHQPENDRRTHSQLALAAGDPSRGTVFEHLYFSALACSVSRAEAARGFFLSQGVGVKTKVIAVLFSACFCGAERSTRRDRAKHDSASLTREASEPVP
jgi:hypothetical protein